MKYFLLAAGILIFALLWYYRVNPLGARVKIGATVFRVDLAITPKDREQGLSGRKGLASDEGMLFVFDQKGAYHFWMRGMQFPLDFLWIDGNTIVEISENIPAPGPGETPVELAPTVDIDRVLEINAGTAQAFGIEVGDRVEFPQK